MCLTLSVRSISIYSRYICIESARIHGVCVKEGKSRHIILNYEFINAHLHRYGNVRKVYSCRLACDRGIQRDVFFRFGKRILKTVFINITDPYPDLYQLKFEFCQKSLNKRGWLQTIHKIASVLKYFSANIFSNT